GAPGFEILQGIAALVTKKFGTSFRNSRLTDTNFSSSELHNTDFSNADISHVQWGDSKRVRCIMKNDNYGVRRK
ncbi:MAG TPA: pentapeptide repeat-containing protein, partial [Ferruginibacter sp.]|nr:pentapeptide repeat-containing protein [Ferruginibacter sp.]